MPESAGLFGTWLFAEQLACHSKKKPHSVIVLAESFDLDLDLDLAAAVAVVAADCYYCHLLVASEIELLSID